MLDMPVNQRLHRRATDISVADKRDFYHVPKLFIYGLFSTACLLICNRSKLVVFLMSSCDMVEHIEFDGILFIGIATCAIRRSLMLSGDTISVALSDK